MKGARDELMPSRGWLSMSGLRTLRQFKGSTASTDEGWEDCDLIKVNITATLSSY